MPRALLGLACSGVPRAPLGLVRSGVPRAPLLVRSGVPRAPLLVRSGVPPALLLMALSGTAACGETDAPAEGPGAPPPELVRGEVRDPLPPHHPDPSALRVASRGPRRLSVDELERSWEAVADLPPGSVQIPENLARSLGEPDWMSVTEPSLEPSPLFMKFMVDLGAILCRSVLEADAQRPPADRVLVPHPDDVEANLRQLLLRFWALDAPSPDHPDRVRLRAAFEAGRTGAGGDASGWWAVCIALTTAPEFLIY